MAVLEREIERLQDRLAEVEAENDEKFAIIETLNNGIDVAQEQIVDLKRDLLHARGALEQ